MTLLSFKLSENLFVRDPQATLLGQHIIEHSIIMIDKLGFEDFTFKKLAKRIQSTEASVYRYFENKHKLLIYLIDWYWTWLDYRIDFHLSNISDPVERLKNCMVRLTEEKAFDPMVAYVHEPTLERIVVAEFEKTYLTRQVDADNKEGLFLPYKTLCNKVAGLMHVVNPGYAFPHSLASTLITTINHQLYYARHLPSLSDIKYDPKRHHKNLLDFVESLVFNNLKPGV